jgi:hypothetical protein
VAGTVVILGAGATRSVHAEAPLTSDILPSIMKKKAQPWLQDFATFIGEVFHVAPGASNDDYPGLPLLMSLLDTALDRKQAFQGRWDLTQVAQMRQAVEFGIFRGTGRCPQKGADVEPLPTSQQSLSRSAPALYHLAEL